MGDIDVVGQGGGASSLDSGDTSGLASSRALMEGGSLPPRKRLLAGLKQNGWLSTSPPPVSPTAAAGLGSAGGRQAVGVGEGTVALSGSAKHEDGCMGCNVVEASGMRKFKRGGVSLRLCSSCALLYSKSMFCPHCLAMYHDASLLGDPSMWLVCIRCRRSVHPECEQKHSGSIPDASSYVCPDCVNAAKRQRESNGITGVRSKPSSGRSSTPNCPPESGSGASPAVGAECSSPALKKPRLMRERSSCKSGDQEHGDGSKLERHRSGPNAVDRGHSDFKAASLGPLKKAASQPQLAAASSPQEAAVAAKKAADAAVKAATAAKANAAAKASAAVKAAAAAKAALEAAAQAAKAAAAARSEFRRKNPNAENRLAGSGVTRLEINVHPEIRRERSSGRGEVKAEREDGHIRRGGGAGSVDDEELARQLHRVMNSSPRISRGATPMRRKASVKAETPSSGVSNSSGEAVRVRPRTGMPSPLETPQHPFKQQQTRPRSVTHKEFRRVDVRVSKHDVKKGENNEEEAYHVDTFEHVSQEASNHSDSHPSQDMAGGVKAEAIEGVSFPPVGVHDDASILLGALVEVDGESLHGTAGAAGSLDRRPDYLQEILEAAVLTDTVVPSNERADDGNADLDTVRPGATTNEQAHKVPDMSDVHLAANEGGSKDVHGSVGEKSSSEAATVRLGEGNASSVVKEVEMQEAGPVPSQSLGQEGGASGPSDVREATLDGTSAEVMELAEVGRNSVAVSIGSASIPVLGGGVSSTGSDERRSEISESPPQSAVAHKDVGPTWQQTKLKAIPSGSQALATGVSLAPFGSTAQMPIRTPAFASGPAGRHA